MTYLTIYSTAYLRDTAVLVPNHCNKANNCNKAIITIEQVIIFLLVEDFAFNF